MKQTIFAMLLCAPMLGGCGSGLHTQSVPDADATRESAAGPPLKQMPLARAPERMSVPVDVHYSTGEAAPGQPMTLHLAFVPRVAGENLRVEFPHSKSATIETPKVDFVQQKADAASVIRRSIVVTPLQESGARVRVIVSMDVEGGRFFSVFSIPVGADGATAPK
jgi:hypothetical protein